MTHANLCEQLSIELEQEYSKRVEEIHKVENFFRLNLKDDSDDIAGLMRKSLVILIYAHFEGYCKQALQFYILYINKEEIPICDVKAGLVAASLNVEFHRLFDTNYKPIKLRPLLSDGPLQLHARKSEFLLNYDGYVKRQISLKEDIINTESNLSPDVLRKLLFQVEIDYSVVDLYKDEIHKLVNLRNHFAHGELIRYPSQNDFDSYKSAAFNTMKEIKTLIQKAFSDKAFLKAI
jgi:hypothetical protein